MSRRTLTFSHSMGFLIARGLMKEKMHNLRFPAGIFKSKDKEDCFYKSIHREYRLHTKERESNHL